MTTQHGNRTSPVNQVRAADHPHAEPEPGSGSPRAQEPAAAGRPGEPGAPERPEVVVSVPATAGRPGSGPAAAHWQAPRQPSWEADPAETAPTQASPAASIPPAEWGWRGRANRLTGGALTFVPTQDELMHRAARRRMLRPFNRTMTVLVANPKGGAAKTPTTLLTAASFGHHRGGYTLAWDNNETRGTLGLRGEAATHQQTVVDLLHRIDEFLAKTSSVGTLAGYLRPQSARFDILASDETPGRMEIIDDRAFSKLWSALSRFYRVILLDSGNNVRAANWQAAVDRADCLVVPTTVQRDVAESGLWMLEHLIQTGRAELAANAVAIISCADPKTDPTLLAEITERYRAVVRDVALIPYDDLIRSGGRIQYDMLTVETRRASLLACTSIIDSLALRDQG